MDIDIELFGAFMGDTPQYSIAVRKDFDIGRLEGEANLTIASHPAPTKILDYYKDRMFNDKMPAIKLFPSTSAAAKNVDNGKMNLCLTNAEAANLYSLKFISDLYDISMVWSIFGSRKMLLKFVAMIQY